jgi:predicted nuclease of predicted toxin-antitoxin system
VKFLLDENVEFRVALFLRQQGHDVAIVARAHPSSLDDDQVLKRARREGRVLITNDRVFGELIIRRGLAHAGVIFFRLTTQDPQAKIRRLSDVLNRYSGQLDHFIVVTDRRIRVRP